jgi:Holliday junction resolvasome RuvABC endonuclease subunit
MNSNLYIAGIDPSMNGTGICKFKLNENFDIVEYDYISFTQIKKIEDNNIYLCRHKDFKNNMEKSIFTISKISEFVSDCEYIAREDYAMGAIGMIFDIAEFVGCLKMNLYSLNKKIRMYSPKTVKKFNTLDGNADKIKGEDVYHKNGDVLKLNHLPEYKSPKLDIIDAYFICNLLHNELKLRHGISKIKDYHLKQIEVFNSVTKSNPNNILTQEFLSNE